MATEQEIGVDLQISGNKLLNKGEENIASSSIITPTILGADTNNYNPTSLQTSSIIRLSSSLAISLTGVTAPNTARNKVLFLYNVGAFNITLVNASASSTAGNRFNMGANLILAPNSGIILTYDQVSASWLCFGRNTSSQSGATVTGTATLSGQVIFNGDVTGTINANTNDYNPVGLANANRLLLNCTGAFSLTGIVAQSIGTTLIIINTSNANTLRIANNNVGSAGANRFLMNANVLLAPNQSCMVQYDLTNARWRVISHL